MNLFETYYNYFETAATAHPDIAHSASAKAFEFIKVEEAFGDFRTSGKKGTILRLLEFSYTNTQDDTPLRNLNGGFLILSPHSNREEGKDGFIEAMKKSDRVANDVIHHMIYDSRNGHELFRYSLNRSNSINVNMAINHGDIGYSGFIVTFLIQPSWEACLDLDPFLVNAWLTPDDEEYAKPDDNEYIAP